MPIDSSIPLSGREFRVPDMLGHQRQAAELRALEQAQAYQQEDRMRAEQERVSLADLYRQHGNDQGALLSGMAQRGMGARIPGMQKQFADVDKEQEQANKFRAETEKIGVESMMKRFDYVRQTIGSLAAMPNPTQRDVITTVSQSPPEIRQQALGFVQSLRGVEGPELKQALMRYAMNAEKQFEAFSVSAAQQQQSDTARRGQDVSAQTAREGHGVTMRGQDLTNARARELNANAAAANEINREAQQSQIINDPNIGPVIVNKGTKTATRAMMDGAPVPGEESVKAGKRAANLLSQIQDARALLPNATGSGVGSAYDKAAGLVGATPKGAEEASRLATISGWMVSNVPRMEGPQSNFDVQNYQQMAAQVGDSSVPVKRRLAALDQLESLQRKYAHLNGGSGQAPRAPIGKFGGERPSLSSFER